MSEKQAKRLRRLETSAEAYGTRLTACEDALAWMQAQEEARYGADLETARKHLRWSRMRARNLEEAAHGWKTVAVTAIAVLAVVAFGMLIL